MTVVLKMTVLKISSVGVKKKGTTNDFPDRTDDGDLRARLTVYELV